MLGFSAHEFVIFQTSVVDFKVELSNHLEDIQLIKSLCPYIVTDQQKGPIITTV